MEKGEYKIFYIGLHPDTLVFLHEDPNIVVSGVNFLEYFFSFKTLNPINYIFKLVYFLRIERKYRSLEKFLFKVFYRLSDSSSSVAYKYKEYLKIISEKDIPVLDVDEIKEVEEFIKKEKIDLIVVNSWSLLPDEIVFAPKFGSLNIHPSKLPQYRGSLPTLWTLKNKDRESAVSYLIINDKVDGGKIISRHPFGIVGQDTSISLENKIDDILKDTLADDIGRYVRGEIIPMKQDSSLKSGTAKYAEYREIKWQEEQAKDIYNKIMLYPYLEPEIYCYFYCKKRKIEIRNARFVENQEIYVNAVCGNFAVKKMNVAFQAKGGIIECRLFKDIGFFDSLYVINERYL